MPKPLQYNLEFVLHPERDAAYKHFQDSQTYPFDPNAGLSRVNVWWLAEAALASYWDEKTGGKIFAQAGFASQFLSAGSTQCFVAWQKTFVIVAFRGTQPDKWDDILTDAKAAQKKWDAGDVHSGFADALHAIWGQLEDVLASLAEGRSVWFCGHSLGAALAVLAAYRYAKNGGAVSGVCTFGCPRVGNPAFAEGFDADLGPSSLRYVNDNDIVTHVPPPVFLFLAVYLYRHVKQRRHIAADGTVSTASAPLEHFFTDLFGSLGSLLGIIKNLIGSNAADAPAFVLDHMPKAYAVLTWNDYERNG